MISYAVHFTTLYLTHLVIVWKREKKRCHHEVMQWMNLILNVNDDFFAFIKTFMTGLAEASSNVLPVHQVVTKRQSKTLKITSQNCTLALIIKTTPEPNHRASLTQTTVRNSTYRDYYLLWLCVEMLNLSFPILKINKKSKSKTVLS